MTWQQLFTCAVRSGPTWNPHRPLEMNGQETEETRVVSSTDAAYWLATVGINGADGHFSCFVSGPRHKRHTHHVRNSRVLRSNTFVVGVGLHADLLSIPIVLILLFTFPFYISFTSLGKVLRNECETLAD